MTYDAQQADPLGRPRQADMVEFDEPLFNYYRALIMMRKQVPALRRGSCEVLLSDDKAHFLAFQRADEQDAFLVGLNRGNSTYEWEIPLEEGDSVAQVFVASGVVDHIRVAEKKGAAVVTVPACEGVVLKLSHGE